MELEGPSHKPIMTVSPDGKLPFFANNPPFFLPFAKGFLEYLPIIIAAKQLN